MKDFKMTEEALKQMLAELNEVRKAAGLEEITAEAWKAMKERQEGGNGFALGESIHLTGEVEIAVVNNTVQGQQVAQNTYFAAVLTDGRRISLRNLIKPNLAGYKFEGTFKEDNGKKGNNRTEVEYTAQHTEDFDALNTTFWDADTRNVLELYMAIKAGKKTLPSGLTLVAQGCKPIIATKPVKTTGGLDYDKGAHRVMRVNVWEAEQ